jgi:hypothetical protein
MEVEVSKGRVLPLALATLLPFAPHARKSTFDGGEESSTRTAQLDSARSAEHLLGRVVHCS